MQTKPASLQVCIRAFSWLTFVFCICLSISSCSTQTSQTSSKRILRFRDEEQQSAREHRDNFIRAVNAYALRDYYRALALLASRRIDTNDADVHYLKAKCYQSTARTDSADYYCRKSLELNPEHEEAWITLGEILVSRGNYPEAATSFDRAYQLRQSVSTRYFIARCLAHFKPDSAIVEYKDIFAQTHDITVLFELAELYESQGRMTDYQKTQEQILDEFPTRCIPGPAFMQTLLEAGRYDQALSLLEHSPGVSSDQSDLSGLLQCAGRFFEDTTMRDAAIISRFSKLADRIAPQQVDLRELSAMLWERSGDSAEALRSFIKAARLDTSDNASLRAAQYYVQSGRRDEARQVLLADSARLLLHERLCFYAGLVLSMLDSNEHAAMLLERATRLDSSASDSWFQRAFVLDKLHRFVLSDSCYERCIALDSENVQAMNNLAYSFAERGISLEKALLFAGKALKAQPTSPSFLDTYGWILHKMGRYDEASEYLGRATTYNPSSATLFEHVGDNYAKLGKRDSAVEAWKRAFELDSSKRYLQTRLQNSK